MPSTVIAQFDYDAATRILRVTYVSGVCYQYFDVPEAVYLAMKQSGAKGIYLNKFIKGKYAYERIEPS